jgi:hypothetical protein
VQCFLCKEEQLRFVGIDREKIWGGFFFRGCLDAWILDAGGEGSKSFLEETVCRGNFVQS